MGCRGGRHGACWDASVPLSQTGSWGLDMMIGGSDRDSLLGPGRPRTQRPPVPSSARVSVRGLLVPQMQQFHSNGCFPWAPRRRRHLSRSGCPMSTGDVQAGGPPGGPGRKAGGDQWALRSTAQHNMDTVSSVWGGNPRPPPKSSPPAGRPGLLAALRGSLFFQEGRVALRNGRAYPCKAGG